MGLYGMTKNSLYRFDTFNNNQVLHGKKKGRLPAMGWNSWNAFGSGNTEELTRAMADKLVELGLRELGYEYVVLDDGCYKPERVDGLLSNESIKFAGGFGALSDYIHERGLKFGMYNDIGTNLCAGAAVGTCGHEKEDAKSYIDWNVDFLKVDNCYYPWDNATFSDPKNARFVFAPNIKALRVIGTDENNNSYCVKEYSAAKDGVIIGERAFIKQDYVTFIGTFDGTGPDRTPIGLQSSELHFTVNAPYSGEYKLVITYASGVEEGVGEFIQIALGEGNDAILVYDDFVTATDGTENFIDTDGITVRLSKGDNLIRIMNHRRQENTLGSYATLVEAVNELAPDNDMILSICEWGKTFPNDWGYKVGDSWRILNDITFHVGADKDPGVGEWESDYTNSITSQYNKAVIMDEYAGLDKGWNDPDMMMIGMNGLDETMCRTHMTMWCMMNSPLMLGLDLRRIEKGDSIWNIIANRDVIALNRDSLGIQAKRIYSSAANTSPDKEYIRDNRRVDVLAKPLDDGSVALSFINLDKRQSWKNVRITTDLILEFIGKKMVNPDEFRNASAYVVTDLWSGQTYETTDRTFTVDNILPCDNVTLKVSKKVI